MLYLKRNLRMRERALRLCFAILIAFGTKILMNEGLAQTLLFITAAILVMTSIIGFCPSCAMLGRKSIGLKK